MTWGVSGNHHAGGDIWGVLRDKEGICVLGVHVHGEQAREIGQGHTQDTLEF